VYASSGNVSAKKGGGGGCRAVKKQEVHDNIKSSERTLIDPWGRRRGCSKKEGRTALRSIYCRNTKNSYKESSPKRETDSDCHLLGKKRETAH